MRQSKVDNYHTSDGYIMNGDKYIVKTNINNHFTYDHFFIKVRKNDSSEFTTFFIHNNIKKSNLLNCLEIYNLDSNTKNIPNKTLFGEYILVNIIKICYKTNTMLVLLDKINNNLDSLCYTELSIFSIFHFRDIDKEVEDYYFTNPIKFLLNPITYEREYI